MWKAIVNMITGAVFIIFGLTILAWMWIAVEPVGHGLNAGVFVLGMLWPTVIPFGFSWALLVLGITIAGRAAVGLKQYAREGREPGNSTTLRTTLSAFRLMKDREMMSKQSDRLKGNRRCLNPDPEELLEAWDDAWDAFERELVRSRSDKAVRREQIYVLIVGALKIVSIVSAISVFTRYAGVSLEIGVVIGLLCALALVLIRPHWISYDVSLKRAGAALNKTLSERREMSERDIV